MNTRKSLYSILKVGLPLIVLFCALPALANPIPIPLKPVARPLTFAVGIAILLEAICWYLCLRRFQKPRLFILWILGMHLLTFPGFVLLLNFLDTLRPSVAVPLGEGSVVLLEGFLVFIACNFLSSERPNTPAPRLIRCWLVSLVSNICSVVAFPVLMRMTDRLGW